MIDQLIKIKSQTRWVIVTLFVFSSTKGSILGGSSKGTLRHAP